MLATTKRAYTSADLIAFEDDIAACFARGEIKAPVHLGGGNEQQLIRIFRDINADDWILCGWRSHYHCLLKGVPPHELKEAILAGHSVSLTFPRQKVFCSGIVGGIAPIAVGIAWALKQKNDNNPHGHQTTVHCFLGDMTLESGIVYESMKYAVGHGIPIRWIVEDNGISVCSPTQETWGEKWGSPADVFLHAFGNWWRYGYKLTRAHVGIDRWVRF